jgi:pectinesterase
MHRLFTVLLIATLLMLAATAILAQTPASATWSCTDPATGGTGQTVALSGQVTAPDELLHNLNINQYSGYNYAQRLRIVSGPNLYTWPAGQMTQIDTVYVEFSISPKTGYKLNVTDLTMDLGCHSINNFKANVWYSTAADFSNPVQIPFTTADTVNNYLPRNTSNTCQVVTGQPNLWIGEGETFYLRVYPWVHNNASATSGKYLTIQNVVISGKVEALPVAGSATWALTNPAAGGTGLTAATAGNLIAPDEKLVNTEINQYTGYNNSQRVRIKGNSWPAGLTNQIDTVYVEFSVTPKPGSKFTVTALLMDLGCHSLNNMKANVWYSKDPAFLNPVQVVYQTADTVNNYLPRNTSNTVQIVTAQPDLLVDQGETFYLRVYPWVDQNASVATGKYLTIQNVVIGGLLEAAPMPAVALWPFEADDKPETSGPVNALQLTYSPAMKWYGTTNLPDLAGNTLKVGAIQTVSKTWNAEPVVTDSLWFQFAVAPKFGGTFFTKGVSLYLGGWFTQSIKAELRYSRDPAFATYEVLIPDTLLVGNKVMPLAATLEDTLYSGETLYLRIYPHNMAKEGWAKLVAVDSMKIWGSTMGVAADPPVVATNEVSNISTTFATCGGNVSTDGGSPVTAKGVCWGTVTEPTVDGSKTVDGAGSGSFVSQVTGLTPGQTWYLRAWATNDAGTAYGEERVFKTLDSLSVPAVTTAETNTILAKSAKSGGTVVSWGGDTLRVRGVCWNTTGDPTIADSKTENGTGLGVFTSTLAPLLPSTTYYVRAYATNDIGTGYGVVDTFSTQAPAPAVLKIVAQDGSGDYTTVQAAFNDVPDLYTGMWCIYVKAGTYKEKLMLGQNKSNVVLKGQGAENTILTYDDYAGKPGVGGTSNCYSTAIESDDFVAMDITFQNTVKNDGSAADQQAVALRVNGDRQSYYNCHLLGYQDTYYTWGGRGTGRTYMKNCYIEGSVDFIFGRNIVVFDDCEIHINRDGGTLTAASTDVESRFGYVFMDCKITADSIGFNGVPITKFILGRPWQSAPRTVFIRCDEPATLNPDGWSTWNVAPALYAEYQCFGGGSDYSKRISIGRQLTDDEAAAHTLANIFAKTSHPNFGYDWLPEMPIFTGLEGKSGQETVPTVYELSQNYPNPFNPVTTINYALPKAGKVRITIYNILGARVATLVDRQQAAGRYSVRFDGLNLGSGTYFYHIEAGAFRQTRKMLLLK